MIRHHPIQNETMMMVTTNTQNRRRHFYQASLARTAIETLYRVQEIYPFFLHGFVIMPDHCHLLLRVPAPLTISRIVASFKYAVSMHVKGGHFWQSRFHLLIPHHPAGVLRYIHQNPVRAGLAGCAEQYPWSSASGRWDVVPLDCG